MLRWRGDIDAFSDGFVRGWAIDSLYPGRALDIAVLIGDCEPLLVRADRARTDTDDTIGVVGEHGFEVDLTSYLVDRRDDLVVRFIMEDGTELSGSPLRLSIPPEIAIESADEGILTGWAIGAWNAPTDVEIWHDGRLLLSWPAHTMREDLRAAGIGNGQHGFSIPLQRLLSPPPGLTLQLRVTGHGAAVPFTLPEPIQTKPALQELIQHRIPTADQLAKELLAATNAAMAPNAEPDKQVKIAFDVMQVLLDRISQLRSNIDTCKSLYTVGEHARAIKRAYRRPAHHPAYDALEVAAAPRDPRTMVEHIDTAFLPAYSAMGDQERAGIHDLIAQSSNRFALRHLAKQARKIDFLQLADVSYATQLALSEQPTLPNLQHAEKLKAWADLCRSTELKLPARQVVPVNRHPRTLYTLWRCVPYDTNGYATRSHYLLRGFAESGHDVIACTRLGYPWDAEKRRSPDGLIESVDGVTYIHLGGGEVSRLTMPLDAYIDECALRLAQVALASGVDIIHCASNWIAALPALKAARMIGLPFCYEMRGLWEVTRSSTVAAYDRTDHYALFRDMETRVASASDLVFGITSGLKSEMERRGYDGRPIVIAPNGVDLARFAAEPRDEPLAHRLGIGDDLVFGFIGSFVAYEGLTLLCAAAARLKQQGQRFKILLVGDGPAFAQVNAEVQRLGVGDVVIITGRVPFETVPQYYSLVHAAIFPRLATEITEMVSPLKPFEAMAMEKPVVGSNVQAIAEIVRHGETGWLFQKDDLESLCRVMSHVIAARGEVLRFGKAARAYVENYHSWPIIAADMAKHWDRLRAERSAAGDGSIRTFN